MWNELVNAEAKSDNAFDISVSVFRDAVLTFVSCFDNTLSAFLDPKVVYAATSGGVEYIGWLKELRNTWIAHRGGPNRQCVAAIVIDEDTGEFRALGQLSHLYMGPKPDAGDDLVRVMKLALSHARKEVTDRETQLRKDIQTLENAERLRLPAADTVIPGPMEIHMGGGSFGMSSDHCAAEANSEMRENNCALGLIGLSAHFGDGACCEGLGVVDRGRGACLGFQLLDCRPGVARLAASVAGGKRVRERTGLPKSRAM